MIATSNFLIPNGTFFVEIIAFVIVFWFVAKYALPPLNKSITERQQNIAQSLKVIDESKEKIAEAATAYEQAMSKAHEEGRAILERANHLSEEIRAESRQKAQAEYDRILAQATADIENARAQAVRDLRVEAAELALTIAGKVIDAELDAERHRHLIDEVVSALETKV